MKKKGLLAAITAVSIVCCNLAAYGAMEQIGDGGTVCISGNAGEANAAVAIEVYQGALEDHVDGTSLLDLNREQYLSILACHDQGVTDEGGNYSFTFNINLPSGQYTAYIATENNMLPAEEFLFVTNQDFKHAAELTNAAANAAGIQAYLTSYTYELGLTESSLKEINVSKVASVLYETLKQTPLDPNSRDTSWNIVRQAVLVEKLNEQKISNLFTESDSISGLSKGLIRDWYNKAYVTDALRLNMTERLSGKSLASYQAYEEAQADAFILATVKEPNGNANVKNIMTAFAGRIGIEAGDTESSVWSGLAGQDYATLEKLKAAFNTLKNSSSSQGTGNSSGGGSRGGSSSSGTVIMDQPQQTNATDYQLDRDIFTDLSGVEWAKTAIVALAEKGIVNGTEGGLFHPDYNITREEFCKMIVGAFVPNTEAGEISFSDAYADAWYYSYLQKAYTSGIIKGTGDGAFGVGKQITRQDMAVMVYHAAQKAGRNFDGKPDLLFEDDNAIADYAREAVYALKNNGAISGISETEFDPQVLATRAQAAKMIYALISGM